MIETAQKPQKAILVSVCSANMTMERTNEYLSELAFLLETAGGESVKTFVQKLERPDVRTYVGKGKLEEVKEAVDAAFMAYAREYKDAVYCIGTAAGPHPFPLMVRDFQFCIGEEARSQFIEQTGHLPDQVVACVGGGSNSIGMFTPFLADPVELVGVEPLGRGPELGDHAASITYGSEGIMHGFKSIMLSDADGNPAPVYSNASGLDYPAAGPEHALLHDMERVKYATVDDDEAIEALFLLSRHEGIIPAIESSHALAYAIRVARRGLTGSILVNLSGRGDKDLDFVVEKYGYGPDFLEKMAKRRR